MYELACVNSYHSQLDTTQLVSRVVGEPIAESRVVGEPLKQVGKYLYKYQGTPNNVTRRRCNAACCSRAVAALLPTPTHCRHRCCRRRASTPTAQLTESCQRRRAAAFLPVMLPPSCHRRPPLPPPPLRCRHRRPDAHRHRAAAALPQTLCQRRLALPPPTPRCRRRLCAACRGNAAAGLLPPPPRCRRHRRCRRASTPTAGTIFLTDQRVLERLHTTNQPKRKKGKHSTDLIH